MPKLGQCSKNAKNKLAGSGHGINGRTVTSQYLQAYPASGKVMHRIRGVTLRGTKTHVKKFSAFDAAFNGLRCPLVTRSEYVT